MSEIKVQKVMLGDINHRLESLRLLYLNQLKDSEEKEVFMIQSNNVIGSEFYRGRAVAYQESIELLLKTQKQISNL